MGSRIDNGDFDVVLKIIGSIASRLFCGLFYVVIYSSWRIVLNFRLLSLMCRFIVLLCAACDKEQTEKEKNRFLHNVVVLSWFAANLIFSLNVAIRGLFFNKVPRPVWSGIVDELSVSS